MAVLNHKAFASKNAVAANRRRLLRAQAAILDMSILYKQEMAAEDLLRLRESMATIASILFSAIAKVDDAKDSGGRWPKKG